MSNKLTRIRLLEKGKRVNEWSMKSQRDKLPRLEHVIPHWKVCRGDTVEIMRGKDAGKQGVVRKVLRRQNRLVVRGVNLVKKTDSCSHGASSAGRHCGRLAHH
jgi:polyphosphate kinase 2 (PPK2 family)